MSSVYNFFRERVYKLEVKRALRNFLKVNVFYFLRVWALYNVGFLGFFAHMTGILNLEDRNYGPLIFTYSFLGLKVSLGAYIIFFLVLGYCLYKGKKPGIRCLGFLGFIICIQLGLVLILRQDPKKGLISTLTEWEVFFILVLILVFTVSSYFLVRTLVHKYEGFSLRSLLVNIFRVSILLFYMFCYFKVLQIGVGSDLKLLVGLTISFFLGALFIVWGFFRRDLVGYSNLIILGGILLIILMVYSSAIILGYSQINHDFYEYMWVLLDKDLKWKDDTFVTRDGEVLTLPELVGGFTEKDWWKMWEELHSQVLNYYWSGLLYLGVIHFIFLGKSSLVSHMYTAFYNNPKFMSICHTTCKFRDNILIPTLLLVLIIGIHYYLGGSLWLLGVFKIIILMLLGEIFTIPAGGEDLNKKQ